MKILIVGATGGTGKQLVAQALARGHEVTVLVRNPKKISIQHPNLSCLKGDVLKPATLIPAITGQDAVLSALGHKKFVIPTSILSRGTANIINAMDQCRVTRLICITSLGINDSRFKLGLYYTLFVVPVLLLCYFLDKEKQERLVQKSNLNYTLVRPAALYNGGLNKRYRHGAGLGHYIITKTISRASVAHFILEELTRPRYPRTTVALSN